MRKCIINPGVGEDIDAFESSEETDGSSTRTASSSTVPVTNAYISSGIVAIDEDGDVIAPGDVERQTRVILNRVESYLADVGGAMEDIVRVWVYVDGYDESDLVTIHEVRDDFFDEEHYPASTLAEVDSLTLEGLRIEFDADAIVPEDGWEVSEP